MIYVAYTRLDDSKLDALYSTALSCFQNPACRGYIDALASRRDRDSACRSLAALILLYKLAQRVGLDTKSIVIKRNGNGKPYFEGGDAFFSITHSSEYVAVALSESVELGIDLEASRPSAERCRALADRYFHGSEKEEFSGDVDSFLRLWTKKEAYVKLFGLTMSDQLSCGFSRDFSAKFLEIDTFPLTICTKNECPKVILIEETLLA